MANEDEGKWKGGSDSHYWERIDRTEDEIPKPLYCVFCRICCIAEMAVDQLAAAQRVLLEVCETAYEEAAFQVFSVHSSVYGRVLCCKGPAAALDAAQWVLNSTASKGVRLAIGVATGGRVERVGDLGVPNLIGDPINLAARLAAMESAVMKIAVTPEVAAGARAAKSDYKDGFGPEQPGQVKHTQFKYSILRFSAANLGKLPPDPGEFEQFTSHVVVYDVANYSTKPVEQAWDLVTRLKKQVLDVIEPIGGRDLVANRKLWYSPAGDGGVLVFAHEKSDTAWIFARHLAHACRDVIEIRLGIATGLSVVLKGNLPVGRAIVRADNLCGYPETGQICVDAAFWSLLRQRERDDWRATPATNDETALVLFPVQQQTKSELDVLEPDVGERPAARPPLPLTPLEPQQSEELTGLWTRFADCAEMDALDPGSCKPHECAWLVRFPYGRPIDDFVLTYDRSPKTPFDSSIREHVDLALRSWMEATSGKRSKADKMDIKKERLGTQVRLESVIPSKHGSHKCVISLSPTNYYHYVAVQARLWDPSLRALREIAFRNALGTGPFLLPSHFAVHMAVIGRDTNGERHALLRQRRWDTELYPGAWEAGIGEFMHGPEYAGRFPHFSDRKPDLGLYLKNAVAEELDVSSASDENFLLYGFAVEYRTLAPKLLVVYESDVVVYNPEGTGKDLIRGVTSAQDYAQSGKAIPLTGEGLARAFADHTHYATWGPTSKLALVLAYLGRTYGDKRDRLIAELAQKISAA